MTALLEVRGLAVRFPSGAGEVDAVRDVSLELDRGEILGLAGESGAGKSLTALAALGLVPAPGHIAAGSIRFEGRELRGLSEADYRPLRGGRIGWLGQEPGAALDPVWTVGQQLVEAIRAHLPRSAREARRRSVELLEQLALPDPARCLDRYPFELSGGQRQRVLLALALAADPDLLVADEPTAALDATVGAEVLALLAGLRRTRGLAILLISHDLRGLAAVADRIAVMYAGEVIEHAGARELVRAPRHPYTRALIESLPRIGRGGGAPPALQWIPGLPPSPAAPPPGCAFEPRCPARRARCAAERPAWSAAEAGRDARCHYPVAP